MKKTLKSVIALLLMISAWSFPISIHANENDDVQGNEVNNVMPTGSLQSPPEPISVDHTTAKQRRVQLYSQTLSYSESELFQELESRIKDALLNDEKFVDIADLQIDRKTYQIGKLIYYSPYLSNGINISCYYALDSNQYTEIGINNPMNVDQTKAYIASVDTELNDIVSQINDSMSDEQKALMIHDYLVYEYEYDYDNLTADTLPDDSFRSGGLIMNRTGVCQAYAYAFYYLMNKFDIECYVTSSDTMNHAWNIIKIDDAYYHIDCTFDDPVRDRLGMVGHNYFLLSDALMQDENHSHDDWDLTNLKCDSDKYSNAYWIGISSKINFDGNTAYYLRSNNDTYGGAIISRTDDTETTIVSDLGMWNVYGNAGSFYTGAYSSLYLKNRELYYNTASQLRKYSLSNGSNTLVSEPDTSEGYIYGSRVRENGIQYVIKKAPNEQGINKSTGSYGIYTIQYILNGGQNTIGNPTSYSSDRATVVLKDPTRSGYSFDGWYSDSTYQTKVTQITKGSSGNKTLYAKWYSPDYQISYQLNGGKNNSANPSTYTSNTATITLMNPTRSGYSFVGWYSDSAYQTKVTQITVGSKGNKTLYAKWTPTTYKITYQLNGGKNNSANKTTYNVTTPTFTFLNPTRSGYTFNGWYSDSNYTKRVTSVVKGSVGNKTLYAKWTPTTYKITYQLNGGKNNSTNKTTYNVTSPTFTIKNPTRSGYTFNGWYSDSKYTKRVTSVVKGSIGNKTLYAKWTPTTYKITYQLNGGKNNSTNKTTYNVSSPTFTIKNPTRSGYTFNGWYSDSKYTKKVTSVAKGSIGNRTLYAKWTANSYKIRYNQNGATSGKMSDTSCRYGSNCTLRNNTFLKKGYSFLGWTTTKNGKLIYKNKAVVKNLVTSNNAIKTLYAKWKLNTYKITYQLNGGTQNKGNVSSYTVNTATITLKNPTRKGYVFKGWYSDKAYKTRVTKITKGSIGNKTLYAKWVKK